MQSAKKGLLLFLLWTCAPGCGEEEKTTTGPPPGSYELLALKEMLFAVDDTPVILLLRPDGRTLLLPLGYCESVAVYMRLYAPDFPRPLPPDLFAAMAESLEVKILRVLVEMDGQGQPMASVLLRHQQREVELPAPVGFGVALSQRLSIELVGAPELLARYTLVPAEKRALPAPADLPAAKRETQAEEWIEMRVWEVISQFGLRVLLIDPEESRVLSILVGACEGDAIHTHLHAKTPVPPYDLFSILLELGGAQVRDARVEALQGNLFTGELILTREGREIALDARPSDALALALLVGAPVEVAGELLAALAEDPAPYRELIEILQSGD